VSEIEKYTEKVFEDIKHIDETGTEYWYARELMPLLGYSKWQRFKDVINKAMITCEISNYIVSDHFTGIGKMVEIGSEASRKVEDFKLSRYACYLITQNGDSRKSVIALAQTYFAIQTRKMELTELEYEGLSEEEKRLYRRKQASDGNYSLNRTARKSGVKNLGEFHNAGYRGLYNGETANDIAKRKKLKYREDILDNMSSEELGTNIFRITQAEAKLKRDKVDNEYTANSVHYEVGKEIRKTIKKLGGTMPENLPTPSISIKKIKQENKQLQNN
jgi:DNA-damage-inducible protein D